MNDNQTTIHFELVKNLIQHCFTASNLNSLIEIACLEEKKRIAENFEKRTRGEILIHLNNHSKYYSAASSKFNFNVFSKLLISKIIDLIIIKAPEPGMNTTLIEQFMYDRKVFIKLITDDCLKVYASNGDTSFEIDWDNFGLLLQGDIQFKGYCAGQLGLDGDEPISMFVKLPDRVDVEVLDERKFKEYCIEQLHYLNIEETWNKIFLEVGHYYLSLYNSGFYTYSGNNGLTETASKVSLGPQRHNTALEMYFKESSKEYINQLDSRMSDFLAVQEANEEEFLQSEIDFFEKCLYDVENYEASVDGFSHLGGKIFSIIDKVVNESGYERFYYASKRKLEFLENRRIKLHQHGISVVAELPTKFDDFEKELKSAEFPFLEVVVKEPFKLDLYHEFCKAEEKPSLRLFTRQYFTDEELQDGLLEARNMIKPTQSKEIIAANFYTNTPFEDRLSEINREFYQHLARGTLNRKFYCPDITKTATYKILKEVVFTFEIFKHAPFDESIDIYKEPEIRAESILISLGNLRNKKLREKILSSLVSEDYHIVIELEGNASLIKKWKALKNYFNTLLYKKTNLQIEDRGHHLTDEQQKRLDSLSPISPNVAESLRKIQKNITEYLYNGTRPEEEISNSAFIPFIIPPGTAKEKSQLPQHQADINVVIKQADVRSPLPINAVNSNKFREILDQYSFFELASVAKLNESQKKSLVDMLRTNELPYQVALLHYLGFTGHLLKQSQNTKTKLYSYLGLILNTNARSIKGNLNVLNAISKENKSRYTAHLHEEKVKKDYQNLK